MSRTLMLASTNIVSGKAPEPAASASLNAHVQTRTQVPSGAQPVTQTEQYWAARALTAETLLSVRATHQEELRAIAQHGEEKRAV